MRREINHDQIKRIQLILNHQNPHVFQINGCHVLIDLRRRWQIL